MAVIFFLVGVGSILRGMRGYVIYSRTASREAGLLNRLWVGCLGVVIVFFPIGFTLKGAIG